MERAVIERYECVFRRVRADFQTVEKLEIEELRDQGSLNRYSPMLV